MKQLIPVLLMLFTLNLTAQNKEDEKAIHQIVQTMVEGWNTADGEKFASVFAEGHDFIVWNGYYFPGSSVAQNAANHNFIFNSIYKDTQNHAIIDKIRFIKDDVALIHVLSAVSKKGELRPENPGVLFTGVLEKKGGNWKILSFHNLDLEVFQDERTMQSAPIPPKMMYASWYTLAKG